MKRVDHAWIAMLTHFACMLTWFPAKSTMLVRVPRASELLSSSLESCPRPSSPRTAAFAAPSASSSTCIRSSTRHQAPPSPTCYSNKNNIPFRATHLVHDLRPAAPANNVAVAPKQEWAHSVVAACVAACQHANHQRDAQRRPHHGNCIAPRRAAQARVLPTPSSHPTQNKRPMHSYIIVSPRS